MNITCRKMLCTHNKGLVCFAKSIHIDKCLNCDMYEKDESQPTPDISRSLYEIAPEIAPHRHHSACKIGCDAKCMFNLEGDCYANGITVNENHGTPAQCVTFIKK